MKPEPVNHITQRAMNHITLGDMVDWL